MAKRKKNTIDVKLLTVVIDSVEDSLCTQGFDMASSEKAQAIARLYELSISKGREPGEMTIDQIVWMGGS